MALAKALYLPNLLCYLRIILSLTGLNLAVKDKPRTAVVCWILATVLDFLDGKLARALGQTSKLGEVLDIVADNVLRSSVWFAVVAVAPQWSVCALCVVCCEWLTLASTQVMASRKSTHWKDKKLQDPWLVRMFFANNFINP